MITANTSTESLKRKRSISAKTAVATRKANALARKRSEAAHRAVETRRLKRYLNGLEWDGILRVETSTAPSRAQRLQMSCRDEILAALRAHAWQF